MKTLSILTLFSMLAFRPELNSSSMADAAEQMALDVLKAFQHNSVHEYSSLFPTLEEFHQIMDANHKLYGDFLSEAKKDFALHYERDLPRSIDRSFSNVVSEGRSRGINWNSVQFVRIEKNETAQNLQPVQFYIVFAENGKEYRLRIENAFIWRGHWKVGQKVQLI